MKKNILIIIFLLSALSTSAQEGFINIYEMGYRSIGFQNIILEEDTLLCLSNAYDTLSAKWGIHFVKMDTMGQVLLERLYLHPDGLDLQIQPNSSIIKTSDNGYAMYGQGYKYISFLKLDHQGEVIFFKTYDFIARVLWPMDIIEVPDGFLLSGYRQRMDYFNDLFIKKVDNIGEAVWERYYGMPNVENRLDKFLQLEDNTFVMGYGNSYEHTSNERWRFSRITAIDSIGDIKWEWASAPEDKMLQTWGLTHTADGGWVYVCRHLEYAPYMGINNKFVLQFVRLDALMNIIEVKNIDELDYYIDKYILDMIPTEDDGWVTIGWRPNELLTEGYSLEAWTSKLSATGDSIWERMDTIIWNEPGGWNVAYGTGAVELPGGSIITCGYSNDFSLGRGSAFLIKMDKHGCITPGCHPIVNTINWERIHTFNAYPNPMTEQFTIEGEGVFDVSIYDLSGRLIIEKRQQYQKAVFNCSHWVSGTYFARIKLDVEVLVKKLVKE